MILTLDTETEAKSKSILLSNYCFRYEIYENGKKIEQSEPFLIATKAWDIDLSIVVPAYNEESRLPKMMTETTEVIHLSNYV